MANNLEFQGLTDFQKKLLAVAPKENRKEFNKMFRKVGNRGMTHVRREARMKIDSNSGTGNYMKGFKRGKVFEDSEGKIVVRLMNKAPHGHLIEYGHRMVTESGEEVGFIPGKHVVENGAKKFQESGDYETMLSRGVDEMIRNAGL